MRSTRRIGAIGRAVGATTLAGLLAAAAACGVPTGDDTFEAIEDADVPLNLAQPSTTTTTTTTTTIPTTTVPAPSTTIETEVQQTAPVSTYFVIGDELLPVVQETISQYTPTSLIDLLVIGPEPETSPGLETLVAEGLVDDVTVRAGVATVEIDESELRVIPRSDRALLFGQIVLTLTVSGRTIGTVNFSVDGLIEAVELPNNRFKRNVTFDDYVELLANAIVVPATTTTSLPPPSTAAEETSESQNEPPTSPPTGPGPTTVPAEE